MTFEFVCVVYLVSLLKIRSLKLKVWKQLCERHNFDKELVKHFPVILSCDPAWQGGDETTIWYQQGHYKCMLEKYKLNKKRNDTHNLHIINYVIGNDDLKADAVHIDQAEGTAIYSYAMDAKTSLGACIVCQLTRPTILIPPRVSIKTFVR
jgi:hypothetical protein